MCKPDTVCQENPIIKPLHSNTAFKGLAPIIMHNNNQTFI